MLNIRTETVNVNLQFNITRELEDNEVLCPTCSGTSLHIEGVPLAQTTNGVYELKKFGKCTTIVGCSSCYFGVQKKCLHCDKLLGRNSYCTCDKSRYEQRYKQEQKEIESWSRTNKITYDEALQKYEMIFIDRVEKYCSPDELAEYLQWYLDDNEDLTIDDILSLRIYGTYTTQASFDAYSILENATEELHEDAFNRAEYVIEDMQEYLNKVANEIKIDTKTFFPDEKNGIQLTIADINKFKLQFDGSEV
ncbi:hypothetical protein GCM10023310_68790 [Paenibacillus vulneris]|uniref:Phage protein n=1 Tax=Paenibacillus vulneris TaxID=1133364 RepID=A0ABW3UHE0_9BACL